jgi:hypothetical protein
MAAHRFVAVLGSRELPQAWALQVAEVVRFFLARGARISSRWRRSWRLAPRRVGARSSSCRARTPPRPGARWGPSSRAAGAWSPAHARGARRCSRGRGGSRRRRRAWSPSSGARRAGRCSRCGRPSGREGRRPRSSQASVPLAELGEDGFRIAQLGAVHVVALERTRAVAVEGGPLSESH